MRTAVPAALAACLALAACAAPGVLPGPGAPQAALVAPSKPPIDISQDQARRFVAVVDRLEPVVEEACTRRNGVSLDCDFQIVVDDRPGMPPNAFQTVDRHGRPILGFTIALLGEALNEDELAFVVAHEASHHILGHLARQDEVAALGAEIFGRIEAGSAGATPASVRQAREVGAAVGARSYSKEWELEADALGAVLAQEAGFDPLHGADFFLRIPDPGDRVLGTHPSNAERIAVVHAAVEGRIRP